jgi:hypothetical protein
MDVWIRNSWYDFDRLLDHLVGKTGLKSCQQHVSSFSSTRREPARESSAHGNQATSSRRTAAIYGAR